MYPGTGSEIHRNDSLGKGEYYASSIFYNDPLLRHQTAMCHVVICSEQTFRDICFVFCLSVAIIGSLIH